MTELLSPLSRRIIAVGLLFLVVITAINLLILPLGQWTAETLSDLGSAREREVVVRHAAHAEAPPLGRPLPEGLAFAAANRDAALNMMSGHISELARTHNIVIDNLGAAAGPGQQSRMIIDFAASGVEIDIVKLMAALEQGSPKIRLESWTIIAPDTAGVPTKLRARAVAIWGQK